MKTVKKLASVVLVGAMALSIAACGSKSVKKISAEDFKSKLEAESYTVVASEEPEEGMKTQISAIGENVVISYAEYESKDDAKKAFDEFKESAKAAKDAGEIEKLSTSSSRITATQEGAYIEIVYAEDMFIMVMGSGDDAKKDATAALKVLGL